MNSQVLPCLYIFVLLSLPENMASIRLTIDREFCNCDKGLWSQFCLQTCPIPIVTEEMGHDVSPGYRLTHPEMFVLAEREDHHVSR